MEYKNYIIEVSAFPDILSGGRTFHGSYAIRNRQGLAATGTVPGGIKSFADAERLAEEAARRWIDRQT